MNNFCINCELSPKDCLCDEVDAFFEDVKEIVK